MQHEPGLTRMEGCALLAPNQLSNHSCSAMASGYRVTSLIERMRREHCPSHDVCIFFAGAWPCFGATHSPFNAHFIDVMKMVSSRLEVLKVVGLT